MDEAKVEKTKSILTSRTIIGGVIMFAALLYGIVTGKTVSEDTMALLIDHAMEIGMGIAGLITVIYGRVNANSKVTITKDTKIMTLFVLGPTLAIALSGCGMQTTDGRDIKSLTPLEQASIAGVETQKMYMELHDTFMTAYQTASPEVKAMLEANVAPPMNKTKAALILYLQGTQTWQLAKMKPDDMDDLDKKMAMALSEATWAVTKFIKKE